jgi:hypothetical protein
MFGGAMHNGAFSNGLFSGCGHRILPAGGALRVFPLGTRTILILSSAFLQTFGSVS